MAPIKPTIGSQQPSSALKKKKTLKPKQLKLCIQITFSNYRNFPIDQTCVSQRARIHDSHKMINSKEWGGNDSLASKAEIAVNSNFGFAIAYTSNFIYFLCINASEFNMWHA